MPSGWTVLRGLKQACIAGFAAVAAGALMPALAQSSDYPSDENPIPLPVPGEHPAEDEDGIVRLPGRGEANPFARHPSEHPGGEGTRSRARLVPGGGLLMSFDLDADGAISDTELASGILGQFLSADANGDGYLMPLEQISWAEGLPTRDDSLANPARFDPNLDRMVTLEEFDRVIRQLARAYAAESADGRLIVASLVADEIEDERARARPFRPEREGSRLAPSSSSTYRAPPLGYGWISLNTCAYQRENTPYMTGRLNADGSPEYRYAGEDKAPRYTPDTLGALCR